jgi:hypothetical protein
MKRAMLFSCLMALPVVAQQVAPQDPNAPKGFANFKVDQMKVDKAIKDGVAYLKSKNASHLNRFDHVNRKMQECELVLWTYVHAGVPESDPEFQVLLKDMLERKLEATYCVSLQAMILEEMDRVKYQQRIWQCAQFLVDNQGANGQWGYGEPTIYAEDPPGVPTSAPKKADVASGVGNSNAKKVKEFDPALPAGGPRVKPVVKNKLKVEKKRDGVPNDNSNTQYAALGMRACHDAGIIIPAAVIDKSIAWYRQTRKNEKGVAKEKVFDHGDVAAPAPGAAKGMTVAGTGPLFAEPQGWCYGLHEHKAYGSMTAGSSGGLAIWLYIKDNDGGKARSWKKDADILDGICWLGKNFSVTGNPGPYEHGGFAENSKHQYYYYMYALERVGMLYGTEVMMTHEWYPEGAKQLIEDQKGGSWGDGTRDTCFAILFLKRATRPLDVATEGARDMRNR